MVTVFEKKGNRALEPLFLCSVPEVLPERPVKKDDLKAKPSVLFISKRDNVLVGFKIKLPLMSLSSYTRHFPGAIQSYAVSEIEIEVCQACRLCCSVGGR